jgi:hypothetical protein
MYPLSPASSHQAPGKQCQVHHAKVLIKKNGSSENATSSIEYEKFDGTRI